MVRKTQTDWENEFAPKVKAAIGNGLHQPEDAWIALTDGGVAISAEDDGFGPGYIYIRRKTPNNPEYIPARIRTGRREDMRDRLCVSVRPMAKDVKGVAWEVIDYGVAAYEQFQGQSPPRGIGVHDHQTDTGGGLLNGAAIGSGTLDDARLSANVMLLDGVQTVTGAKTFGTGDLIADTADLNTPDIDGGTITGATELTVVSTTQGSIPMPVMTEAQRDAIASPVEGMWVFNSTSNTPDYYDGADWVAVGTGGVDASDVTYTPGVSGDWDTPPSEVASGLDELAARVELLEGGGGGAITGVMPSHCDLRLTAESGVPVSITDQSGATSVYLTPYRGAIIALYDGSDWAGYPTAQISLSLAGLDRHRLYDIWCYLNAGSPALESTAWNAPTSAAITGVTNASPPVVTSAAHGLAVGDVVTIYGVVGATGVNTTARISAVSTDTFTLQSLDAVNLGAPGAYSSGGTWVKKYSGTARATALTYQNGVLVKSGDATRRYVGTVCMNATGGETEDTLLERLVFSYVNHKKQHMTVVDATSSWTYGSAAWRATRNDFANRLDFVIGVAEHMLEAVATQITSTSGSVGAGIGIDQITTSDAQVADWAAAVVNNAGTARAVYMGYPSAGLHYIQRMEYNIGGTGTMTGSASGGRASGLTAVIEA